MATFRYSTCPWTADGLVADIRGAIERVGPDRVLHGSVIPFHRPSVELAKVRVSGLSTDPIDGVLGKNGRALFLA